MDRVELILGASHHGTPLTTAKELCCIKGEECEVSLDVPFSSCDRESVGAVFDDRKVGLFQSGDIGLEAEGVDGDDCFRLVGACREGCFW